MLCMHEISHLLCASYCFVATLQRRDSDETGSAKKQRVVWNQEMHQQFVEAVQALGVESTYGLG